MKRPATEDQATEDQATEDRDDYVDDGCDLEIEDVEDVDETEGGREGEEFDSYSSPKKFKLNQTTVLISPTSPLKQSEIAMTDNIVISCKPDLYGNIKVILPKYRAKTNLGGKRQGDHVTAYSIFLRMICKATAQKDIKLVKDNLQNLFKAILPDYADDFEKKIREKFDPMISQTITRDERKIITAVHSLLDADLVEALLSIPIDSIIEGQRSKISALIYGAEQMIKIEPQKIKNTLVMGQADLSAQLIEFLGTELLQKLNIEKDMCFPRNGTLDKAQGIKISKALNGLMAIDKLRSLPETAESKKSFFEEITKKNSTLLFGFRQLFGITAKYNHPFNDLVKSLQENPNSEDLRSQFIIMVKDVKDASLNAKIGEFTNDLFDFKYELHSKTTDVENVLYKLCARHISIIFNAFESLTKVPELEKKLIIDGFLSKVLSDQDWQKLCVYKDDDDQTTVLNLGIDTLRDGVFRYLNPDLISMKATSISASPNVSPTNISTTATYSISTATAQQSQSQK